jgi:signal transduction histidine kinase
MNGILGMARLALEAKPDPAVTECVQTLATCAQSLLHILNDMLDFAALSENPTKP